MPTIISKREIRKCIEEAEAKYQKCWKYLCEIKSRHFRNGNSDCITKFQPELAETIISLNRQYEKITKEKKRLISKNKELNHDWFVSRMKSLGNHQKIIQETLNIGFSIGDAFALIFYKNNTQHLREHLKQKRITHGPTGIGAIGELEFISNNVILHRYFVLYHGTTSLLRIGDISLINLKDFSVAGLGEIKSHSIEPGTITVQLTLSGPGLDLKEFDKKFKLNKNKSAPSISKSLPFKQRERFKRQIKKMEESYESLKVKPPDSRYSMILDYGFKSLENLLRGAKSRRMSYEQFGESLLMAAFRSRGKNLWIRLENKRELENHNILDGLDKKISGVLNSKRKDNSIILGWFYYQEDGSNSHLPGMTHPFWWPIDMELLKEVVFQKTLVMTIYNPLHLALRLESQGYEVTGKGTDQIDAKRRDDKKILELGGLSYYMTLMQQYFYSLDSILDLINEVEKEANNLNPKQDTKIEIDIRQML